MPTKSNYTLKPGVIVHPKGTNQFYANSNIPDEVAETYLAKFPQNINEFANYPVDYLARIEARRNGSAVDDVDVETLKNSFHALKMENESLKVEVYNLQKEVESLRSQLKVYTQDSGRAVSEEFTTPEEAATTDDITTAGNEDVAVVSEEPADSDADEETKPTKRGRKASVKEE